MGAAQRRHTNTPVGPRIPPSSRWAVSTEGSGPLVIMIFASRGSPCLNAPVIIAAARRAASGRRGALHPVVSRLMGLRGPPTVRVGPLLWAVKGTPEASASRGGGQRRAGGEERGETGGDRQERSNQARPSSSMQRADGVPPPPPSGPSAGVAVASVDSREGSRRPSSSGGDGGGGGRRGDNHRQRFQTQRFRENFSFAPIDDSLSPRPRRRRRRRGSGEEEDEEEEDGGAENSAESPSMGRRGRGGPTPHSPTHMADPSPDNRNPPTGAQDPPDLMNLPADVQFEEQPTSAPPMLEGPETDPVSSQAGPVPLPAGGANDRFLSATSEAPVPPPPPPQTASAAGQSENVLPSLPAVWPSDEALQREVAQDLEEDMDAEEEGGGFGDLPSSAVLFDDGEMAEGDRAPLPPSLMVSPNEGAGGGTSGPRPAWPSAGRRDSDDPVPSPPQDVGGAGALPPVPPAETMQLPSGVEAEGQTLGRRESATGEAGENEGGEGKRGEGPPEVRRLWQELKPWEWGEKSNHRTFFTVILGELRAKPDAPPAQRRSLSHCVSGLKRTETFRLRIAEGWILSPPPDVAELNAHEALPSANAIDTERSASAQPHQHQAGGGNDAAPLPNVIGRSAEGPGIEGDDAALLEGYRGDGRAASQSPLAQPLQGGGRLAELVGDARRASGQGEASGVKLNGRTLPGGQQSSEGRRQLIEDGARSVCARGSDFWNFSGEYAETEWLEVRFFINHFGRR